jgi:hypothetical protein
MKAKKAVEEMQKSKIDFSLAEKLERQISMKK